MNPREPPFGKNPSLDEVRLWRVVCELPAWRQDSDWDEHHD